ncbi:superoxide dismutase-like protein YojM [Rhodoferax lithotrophicus]|uniref:Superoxide dismutase [Cu-Zn] n=1 Tax=Rhodoferax lithotrophicus TaxID=2798804 RepID=A0ABN6D8P9_9BURK|nr:superoxide dismutase family protein [Rhodoferax sp. MIZ03]BCO28365.1 superoxide dismutase-like protein YojM [Rhodoferax sp. MIZ03]
MIKRSAPFVAALLVCACAAYPTGPSATVQLTPTQGNAVTGTVSFTQQANAVLVAGEVRGLTPNTEHGFHIHDKGDCSSGDGLSAGGHFNPTGTAHGAHESNHHHAGDLVSLKADASGVARFSYTSTGITVGDGSTNVIGRGLIVHRDADDFKTQPTGNSGPRMACGVITKS